MKKAIGIIEFKSIPIGIEATDAMLKSGNVELVMAQAVCPGKYISFITGDVGAVKASIDNGVHIGETFVLESHVIPNIHPAVVPAMLGTGEIGNVDALGMIETINTISGIKIGDVCVKAANVTLVEIRLARGLGGKSFVIITGDVAAVRNAVKAVEADLGPLGVITSFSVIPKPHKDICQAIL